MASMMNAHKFFIVLVDSAGEFPNIEVVTTRSVTGEFLYKAAYYDGDFYETDFQINSEFAPEPELVFDDYMVKRVYDDDGAEYEEIAELLNNNESFMDAVYFLLE